MTTLPVASDATLAALEFRALLELIAAEARTDLGRARLAALAPAADVAELERRRAAFEEVARLSAEAPLVPSEEEPIAPLVERLASGRPPLDGPEILVLARALAAAGDAARRIGAADPTCPELARRLAGLADPAPLVARIGRVLDRKGQVRDDASPRLTELRRQVQGARERLYSRLESLGAAHRDALGEETIPLRGGRLMLVLQAGARGRLPGLVHGRSASGKSFYFEPLEVVEENNTLQSAVEEQEAERRRILAELVLALAAEQPLVERLAELLAELDGLESALRFGRAVGGRLPGLAASGRLRLIGARHPLLDPRLARWRERVLGAAGHEGEVVPLDLELDGRAAGPGGHRPQRRRQDGRHEDARPARARRAGGPADPGRGRFRRALLRERGGDDRRRAGSARRPLDVQWPPAAAGRSLARGGAGVARPARRARLRH